MVRNAHVEKILRTMPAGQRRAIAEVLKGNIIAEVYCNSVDRKVKVEQPVFAKDGTRKVAKNGELITKTVTETKPGCYGRLMGSIYKDGKFRASIDDDAKMWCRASRHRLDGNWGFQCWCGNDSRLSVQEQGNSGMETGGYTKADIDAVLARVEKEKPTYPVINGKQEVDGFVIQMIGSK